MADLAALIDRKGPDVGLSAAVGVIVGDRMWQVLAQGTDENGPLGHGWIYSAHPTGAAAGAANLTLIDSPGLVAMRPGLGPT